MSQVSLNNVDIHYTESGQVEGSGHFPHLERPREFLQAVTEFLEPH